AAVVQKYRIYTGAVSGTRRPVAWNFQIWFGGGWVTIHSVTTAGLAAYTWYEWNFPNILSGTDYRLLVTANGGDPNWLQINEMEYYLGVVENSVVCYPEDEFTDAPDYDLVLFISQGLSPSMIVQYPGFYEIVVNQSPGRWDQLFQSELEQVFGVIQMDRSWFARLYRQTREGIRSAAQTERTITIGG
ncbi:hypothetical protein LCGC14_1709520, partial [marine sediment metagenome]